MTVIVCCQISSQESLVFRFLEQVEEDAFLGPRLEITRLELDQN